MSTKQNKFGSWKLVAGCVALLGMSVATAATAKDTVKLGYVEWDSCVVATDVAAVALEQAGYDVKTMSLSAGAMYQGLAQGDIDAIVCAWLPNTHKDYYAKTKDHLDNLGHNMDSARLGLAVPKYMKDVNSIADLAKPDVDKALDNRIVGIDPGAGIMRLTHNAIKDYKLPEKLVEGTGAAMTAVLANSIRQKKPVVVTSWTPHWMWAKFKLKFLSDPKDSYGKPDSIDTLVRKGLKKDMPKAYTILNNFKFGGARRGKLMVEGQANDKPMENAKKWVKDHQDIVKKWSAS